MKIDWSALGAADETLTKFDYGICLAAALGYLMIHQQDPVGLVAFDTKLTHGHPAQEQADAARHDPVGAGEPEADRRRRTSPDSLFQLASMIQGKSLVMLFSDLLPTTDDWKAEADAMIRSLYRLRYSGHEVILFHILDELEVEVPVRGAGGLRGRGVGRAQGDRRAGHRATTTCAFVERVPRATTRPECATANVDYVPMDTSVGFDKALLEYLILRQRRFG